MLFSLYEADPEKIDGYADVLVKKSTDIGDVDVGALKGKAKAAEQITGEIDDLLDEPFRTARRDSEQVALASAFAAGVLYRWSAAITAFNSEVGKLNKEYEDKAAANFGVSEAPAGPVGGISPGALEDQHDQDVKDAKSALIRELQERWSRQELALDAAADDADSDLKKGPTEENVLALFATGNLPRTAFPLLAALGIDPKSVMTVLAKLKPLLEQGTIGAGPGGDTQRAVALRELLDAVREADPRAAAVILGTLSAQQQKELGDELAADRDSPEVPGIYSFFLSGATSAQVDGLRQLWDVNPGGAGGWDRPGPHPLFPDDPDMSTQNIGTFIGARQGSVGDCWMLARLNAIVGGDPHWPREHVRDNDNGTISVKFYNDDGSPRWVTVTDDVPRDAAQPAGRNASLWAVYYEKALAQDNPGGWLNHRPGYDGLESGNVESWDTYMTGEDAETVRQLGLDGFSDPYEETVNALAEGKGVVVGNAGWSLTSADDDLQGDHQYYVKAIQDDGDVVLGNPWGKQDATVTREEFEAGLESIAIVNK